MIWVKSAMLALAPFCLALGLVLPLVRFEKLYFFSEDPSLIGIVLSLWQNGSPGLAVLVGLLSIVFPAVKMVGLMAEALAPLETGAAALLVRRIVPHLSKWSMMDVMLVAIVIFAAKTSGLASAFTQPGLWFYAISSVMAGLLNILLRRAA
ncbi:paraquat-inducible protein A [Rhizobium sp. CG5]|nr:paraquat-inducible protein A [Rhizobium sp. CG5]